MALNPSVNPTNDPKYGGQFHPVDAPANIRPTGVATNTIMPEGVKQGDLSGEYEGKAAAAGMAKEAYGESGFATLFSNVASAADLTAKIGVNMVKKDIEDKVYSIADKERQEWTSALEAMKNGPGKRSLMDANASADMPDDIESLDSSLGTLTAARDAGKISQTYYYSKLLSEAKDLRARYPGFREEIDQQFAKVTGVNPANGYIHSLINDINRNASSQTSQRNKISAFILQRQGLPNADKVFQAYQNGLIDDAKVLQWAAPYEREEADLKLRAARMNDKSLTRQDRTIEATNTLGAAASVVVGRASDSLMGALGIHSAEDAANLDSRAKANGIKPQEYAQMGQAINDKIVALRNQMVADADSKGVTRDIGIKARNEQIEEALKPLTAMSDRIYNHDFGGIYKAAKHIEAQRDEDTRALLADTKVGPAFRQLAVQKQIGGEQWLANANLEFLRQGISTKYSAYASRWADEIQTQTQMRDGKNGGNPLTLNDMADEMKAKGVNDAKVNKYIMDKIGDIARKDVPDEIKTNYALSAFSEKNRGFIARLNPDSVDAKGRPISGQNAVFQKWTSPEVTKEMYRLGQSNPKIWEDYRDWTKHTLGSELMPQDINTLAAIPKDNGEVKVGWDSTNKRFVAQDLRTPEMLRARGASHGGDDPGGYYGTVSRMVNRLNTNIGNFKHVAEASGENVDAFVLRTIAEAGGGAALQNTDGIAADVLRQIGLTQIREQNANRNRR